MSTNTISLNSCNTWFVYSTQVVCNWETVPLNEKKNILLGASCCFYNMFYVDEKGKYS